MRKFLVLATILLCSVAHAGGTGRFSRVITDTHPVFDCRSEDYNMKCDWNGTSGTDDSTALQACIDAAAAANKYARAYIGQCQFFTGTTQIEINETVSLEGCGKGTAWGASVGEAEDACTLWVQDDAMAVPALVIKGDGANTAGFLGGSGDWGSEGVRVSGIKFVSETVENGDTAIMLDGTYLDAAICDEPGGCPSGCTIGVDCTCEVGDTTTSTDPICNGSVRSVVLEDIGCYKLGGACVVMRGNVFEVSGDVADYRSGKGGVVMLDTDDLTCNNSACRPGQIRLYEPVLNSCDRDDGYCVGFEGDCTGADEPYVGCVEADDGPTLKAWAFTGGYVTMFGGNIEGDFGASLGQNAGFFGTHFEGGKLSTGSIGVQVHGQNAFGVTDGVVSYDNCIKIGEDGVANQTDGYFFHIGNVSNCTTASLHSEDGATRDGKMDIGQFGTDCGDPGPVDCDTLIVDDRTANIGEVVIQLLGVDIDGQFGVPVQINTFGNGQHANQRIVFNEGEAANLDPTLWWRNSDNLFNMTRDLKIGSDGSDGCSVTSGCTDDVVLTFDAETQDETLTLDDANDQFVFSAPVQVGGSGASITASAGNDFALNVDDGQIVTLDTLSIKACSTITAATATAIDNCNIATMTGATTITSITTCDAGDINRTLILKCGDATFSMTDGSNLSLSAAWDCNALGADSTLSLVCDGTNWLETSRSSN